MSLCALGITVLIEITQYFTGRAADIDDVIMNTVGGMLGFGIDSGFNRLLQGKSWWRKATAVSYTHLVGQMFVIRIIYICAGALIALAANCLVFPYSRSMATRQLLKKYAATTGPVSYTHLDVYKRQDVLSIPEK